MIPKYLINGVWHDRQRVHISPALIDSVAADAVGVCQRLETRPEGLTDEEAAKFEAEKNPAASAPVEFTSVAFLGTSVESGSGTAVVVATGQDTYLGGTASSLAEEEPPTSFDKGIERFTWLILRFVVVMVPLVFLINGFTKGNWHEAFFFAIAVAVGLTPEMLPMVVAVCLSKGAIRMSRERVIVKRLNAIQNLGAMDVLCTDKTGDLPP